LGPPPNRARLRRERLFRFGAARTAHGSTSVSIIFYFFTFIFLFFITLDPNFFFFS
jgi:hypothetical protein